MQRTGHIPFTDNPRANHTAIVTTLQQVLARVDKLETNPTITGDLNMNGHRVVNVGSSRANGDVPSRGELIARGLFENDQRQHVAHSDLICRGNIRSRAQAREPFDLVPFHQLKSILQNFFNALALGDPQTLTLINGANDNIQIGNPSSTIYMIDGPTATFAVSGFVDGAVNLDGRFIILVNPTGFPMTIRDRSNGLSDVGNRIATNKGWDMETQTDGVAIFCYVGSVWRVLATVL